MTPRQALMWFVVALIIIGVFIGAISYGVTKNTDSVLTGGAIVIVGLALGLIAKKIRW